MREPIRDRGRLEHIMTAIEHIECFVEAKNFEDFRSDSMLFFAVVKNIEIIGEAANNLTKELRDRHPEIEWADVIGMRHVLVHDYYNISPTLAWKTANNNIPVLKQSISNILLNDKHIP